MNLTRVEYEVEGGVPVVYLFCREDGKRVVRKSTELVPYFYVQESEKGKFKVKTDSRVYHAIDGTKLVKVYTQIPAEVPELRERYPKHWEADVLFPLRHLVDCVDSLDPCDQKILFIDIETDSGRVPSVTMAPDPIICVTCFSDDTYNTFIFRSDFSEGSSTQMSWDKLHEIKYFRSEQDMLRALVDFIDKEEPDIISGWNVVKFDLTYLINRMKRLGLNYTKLSPMKRVWIDEKFRQDVVIKGVNVIDLLDTYRHFSENLEESYQLDFIGKKVVGFGKIGSAGNIRYMWKHKPEELILYNTNDCRLCYEIDQKLKLLDFLDELRRLCFCHMEDCLSMGKMADTYILRMFHNKMVFPSKTKHEKYEYEGAYVGSWAKGIYQNVVIFDLKSLYPSTIVSLNLSPECIDDNGIKVGKTSFRRSPQGFLPQVIENLFQERDKYKALMRQEEFDSDIYKLYDLRQRAVKTLMNALYGQTAYPGSRFHDARVAESITWVGRNIIQWSKKFLEDIGYEVIYLDTDAAHWVFGENNLNLGQVDLVLELLNDSYDDFARNLGISSHHFNMEFQKVYRKAFYGAALKRYSGHCVLKEGKQVDKIETMGFETRRSDAAQFSKTLMERIFQMLLREDKSKDEVLRYVGDEIDRIRKGDFKFSEMGIPRGLTRDPMNYFRKGFNPDLPAYRQPGLSANIRGVLYATKELGLDISSKPKMIYVSQMPNGYEPIDVLCFDEDGQVPPGTVIDTEKMLTKLVRAKLEPIFDALDWNLSELVYHWHRGPKKGEQLNLWNSP